MSVHRQEHMPGQLSDRHHIGSLLEFESLLIGKRGFVVNDEIRVEWAIHFLGPFILGRRFAGTRQPSIRTTTHSAHAARDLNDLGISARTALEVQLGCPRRQSRSRDDDPRDADEFVHGVRGEIAELQHVEAGANSDLNPGNGLCGVFCVFPFLVVRSAHTYEWEEDRARGFGGCTLKLCTGDERRALKSASFTYGGKSNARSVLNRVGQLIVI